MNSTSQIDPAPFQWEPQPEAAQFIQTKLAAARKSCGWLDGFSQRLLSETGTRLLDWVDHIAFSSDDGFESIGFSGTDNENVFENAKGIFPKLTVAKHLAADELRVGIRVEKIEDFVAAQAQDIVEQNVFGEAHAHVRIAQLELKGGGKVCIVERHGSQSMIPGCHEIATNPTQTQEVLDSFRQRSRDYDDAEQCFHDAMKRIVNGGAIVGRNHACDLFFQAEREYWQSRNKAAGIQHSRQAKLGLGWANHDHHTYRCGRPWFKPLILTLELLGFECRERFYAGKDAGWGAQVLENQETGIVIFADVDLDEGEIAGDFAHEGLEPKKDFGTVGLWCQLHGESFLTAGMHHLECQFDFDAAREQLQVAGVESMAPFTDFPHLKQAFTKGENWPVDQERLETLVGRGVITSEEADTFGRDGARGSHLEVLERNDGYKGFNQSGISKIILQTNPTISD